MAPLSARVSSPRPGVTRPDPLYTVDQPAHVVLAVDEAVKDCIGTNCR
jgi:hypothetical protein